MIEFSRPQLIPALMTIPALIILVLLGSWQLQRLEWKTDLFNELTTRQEHAPITVPLPISKSNINTLKYHNTTFTGTFLHDKEIHIYTGAVKIKRERGFYIITPFQLDGSNHIIAVNRGWIPNSLKDASKRPETLPTGIQTITGALTISEKPTWFTPPNDLKNNVWLWLDIDAMAQHWALSLQPLALLQADKAKNATYPIPPATQINLRNDHLQYAIIWYSLAFALLIIYIIYHRKQS